MKNRSKKKRRKEFDFYDFLEERGFKNGRKNNIEIVVCCDHVVILAIKIENRGFIKHHRFDTEIPRNKTEAKALYRLIVERYLDDECEQSYKELHAQWWNDVGKLAGSGKTWISVPGTMYWRTEDDEQWALIHDISDAVKVADLEMHGGVKIVCGKDEEHKKDSSRRT